MTTPGDGNNGNNSNSNDGSNNGFQANRWSNPSSSQSSGQSGSYPSFGAYPQGGQDQQNPYAPNGGYGQAPQHGTNNDSLFAALFDFGFTKYATPSIIKIAYALGFVFIGLVWVLYVLGAIIGLANEAGAGGFFLGLIAAVVITVGTLFMLMMMRMMLEFYLSNIRIAQSAQSIDERQAAGR